MEGYPDEKKMYDLYVEVMATEFKAIHCIKWGAGGNKTNGKIISFW